MFYQPPAKPVNSPRSLAAARPEWLALASFDGFGTRSLHKLRARFGGDGAAAWGAPLTALEELGIGPEVRRRFAGYRARTDPAGLALRLAGSGIRFVLEDDAEYPSLLRQIADPPFALFVRGQLPPCSLPIAVVGTRGCTAYGRRVASDLVRGLASAGATIVSGLALGIDALAHQAALDAGAACWAVLAGGCDDPSVYPRHNSGLARSILADRGALVSEFPPGTDSLKHHFPLRNRIISGLSRATVVVEAAEGSGSLLTAHLALDQNREVFSVPGPITSRQSDGTNKLLKLGAIPCTGAADILAVLEGQAPHRPPVDPSALSADERRVFDALAEPLQADDIARRLGLAAAETARLLVALEMKGAIADAGGKTYARA